MRPETVSEELFFEAGGHEGRSEVHRPQNEVMEKRGVLRALSVLCSWEEAADFDHDSGTNWIIF